jgi:hypothetical protein
MMLGMKLLDDLREKYLQVEARKGLDFLVASTGISPRGIRDAIVGNELPTEVVRTLEKWAREHLEVVSAAQACPKCGAGKGVGHEAGCVMGSPMNPEGPKGL